MPIADALRWNFRYRGDERGSNEPPRPLLLEHSDLIPKQGLALDIAMGLGGNARFLLSRGLKVVGVDISAVAVKKAKSDLPELMAVIADLESFYIPPNTFNLIIDFLYLQRNIWPRMVAGLKSGGIVMIECLLEEMRSIHPEIDPIYLLKPGELYAAFTEEDISQRMELIYYEEGWITASPEHRRASARLIARCNL